jgi:hypothetical protein
LPTAWDNATYNTGEIVKETSIKHGGNNALRQTSASGTNKIQQEVAITAGKKYKISYWFLDNDTKASSRYWFAMVGSDGKTINDINKQIQQSDYSADNTEWQQVTIEFTAPAGTVKMRYEVRTYRNMDSNESGGYIYYDDIIISKHTLSSKLINYEANHYNEIVKKTMHAEDSIVEICNNNLKTFEHLGE